MPTSRAYSVGLVALAGALALSTVPSANADSEARTPRGGLLICVVTTNDNWRHAYIFDVFEKGNLKSAVLGGQQYGWPDKQIGCSGAQPFRPGKYVVALESKTRTDKNSKEYRSSWVTKVVRSGPTGKAVTREVAKKGQKMKVFEPVTIADKKTTKVVFYNVVKEPLYP